MVWTPDNLLFILHQFEHNKMELVTDLKLLMYTK